MSLKCLKYVLLTIAGLASVASQAQSGGVDLYDGRTQQLTTLSQMMGVVQPGTILILGEQHNLQPIRDQHLQILKGLKAQGLKVSVGMEFLNYTDQAVVDQYMQAKLDDEALKAAIHWGGFDFNLYKDQILFPQSAQGEWTVGLNLTRDVTSRISQVGLSGLTAAETSLLPPQFTLGRNSYFQRFSQIMGGHVAADKLEKYFAAQSAWDDTMAWQTVEFIKKNPTHVFVIIVGEFHVQYGGGLPDRLKARMQAAGLSAPLVTLSQIYTQGLTEAEIQQEMQPSLTEGARADFIWLSK